MRISRRDYKCIGKKEYDRSNLQEGSASSLVSNDQSLEPKHFTCNHNLVVVGYDRIIRGEYWEKSSPRSFISSCCSEGFSMTAFCLREGYPRA